MSTLTTLLVFALAAGFAGTAIAEEHFNSRNSFYDSMLSTDLNQPVRYNTTLYNQRYGNRSTAVQAVADHFNSKSNEPLIASRPPLYYSYPARGEACELQTEQAFNDRNNPRLVCYGGQRLRVPPPLLTGATEAVGNVEARRPGRIPTRP